MDSKLFSQLNAFIKTHFVEEFQAPFELLEFGKAAESSLPFAAEETPLPKAAEKPRSRDLEEVVSQVEESFSQMLFRIIREKGLDEVKTYKRAGIDRKLFSKIRSRDDYRPGKNTAIALALAMELTLDETLDLLGRAGMTLSHSSKADLIVEFFIEKGDFDIFRINEALDTFGQALLL